MAGCGLLVGGVDLGWSTSASASIPIVPVPVVSVVSVYGVSVGCVDGVETSAMLVYKCRGVKSVQSIEIQCNG